MEIKPTTAFKKDIKSIKNNKKAVDELDNVLNMLMQEKELPEKYKNHPLKNNWKGHFDCHILPDLVLIYRYGENVIILDRIGSHSKLRLSESCIRLKIREDTACVPSKTSYMNEDGFYNGIYYFGEPRFPKSWRDFIKSKKKKVNERMSNMVLKENNDSFTKYFEIDSKQVRDADGYLTDYTMYAEYVIPSTQDWYHFLKNYDEDDTIPEEWFSKYVFVFGDSDFYDPNEGYDEFDWECDNYREAEEWFENYDGIYEDDEDKYF